MLSVLREEEESMIYQMGVQVLSQKRMPYISVSKTKKSCTSGIWLFLPPSAGHCSLGTALWNRWCGVNLVGMFLKSNVRNGFWEVQQEFLMVQNDIVTLSFWDDLKIIPSCSVVYSLPVGKNNSVVSLREVVKLSIRPSILRLNASYSHRNHAGMLRGMEGWKLGSLGAFSVHMEGPLFYRKALPSTVVSGGKDGIFDKWGWTNRICIY